MGTAAENLGGDVALARQTVVAFMRAFALVVPSGMKNSFLNQHAPDFLLAVARGSNDGQSLANAFEKPVQNGRSSGYAEPSLQALCAYRDQVEGAFCLQANPTVKRDGKRHAILADSDLTCWLRRKGEKHGFAVDPQNVRSVKLSNRYGRRRKRTWHAAQYGGVLQVSQPETFAAAIRRWQRQVFRFRAAVGALYSLTSRGKDEPCKWNQRRPALE